MDQMATKKTTKPKAKAATVKKPVVNDVAPQDNEDQALDSFPAAPPAVVDLEQVLPHKNVNPTVIAAMKVLDEIIAIENEPYVRLAHNVIYDRIKRAVGGAKKAREILAAGIK